MGHWNAGVGRSRDRRADARDDFKANAGGLERGRFFTAPAEHEGIAALQPNDSATAKRLDDQKRVDLLLRPRVVTALLPDEHETGVRRHQLEQARVHQAVVHDNVGTAEQAAATDGEKTGIARTGADESDASDRLHADLSAWSSRRRASSRRPAATRRRTSPRSACVHALAVAFSPRACSSRRTSPARSVSNA